MTDQLPVGHQEREAARPVVARRGNVADRAQHGSEETGSLAVDLVSIRAISVRFQEHEYVLLGDDSVNVKFLNEGTTFEVSYR